MAESTYDPETERVVSKGDFDTMVFEVNQCARLRKDVSVLSERLEEAGYEEPPGPDLVTLHATLTLQAFQMDGCLLYQANRVASDAIRNALAFAKSVRAGGHCADAGDMVEHDAHCQRHDSGD